MASSSPISSSHLPSSSPLPHRQPFPFAFSAPSLRHNAPTPYLHTTTSPESPFLTSKKDWRGDSCRYRSPPLPRPPPFLTSSHHFQVPRPSLTFPHPLPRPPPFLTSPHPLPRPPPCLRISGWLRGPSWSPGEGEDLLLFKAPWGSPRWSTRGRNERSSIPTSLWGTQVEHSEGAL